jgi:hypothetical protein
MKVNRKDSARGARAVAVEDILSPLISETSRLDYNAYRYTTSSLSAAVDVISNPLHFVRDLDAFGSTSKNAIETEP